MELVETLKLLERRQKDIVIRVKEKLQICSAEIFLEKESSISLCLIAENQLRMEVEQKTYSIWRVSRSKELRNKIIVKHGADESSS